MILSTNKGVELTSVLLKKGNNKITEHRAIFQRERQNCNGPDLVQAFPKKWWVESDFTVPNLPLPLRLKGSDCHYDSIFNNTGTN
jgi:hypothetical protein